MESKQNLIWNLHKKQTAPMGAGHSDKGSHGMTYVWSNENTSQQPALVWLTNVHKKQTSPMGAGHSDKVKGPHGMT